MIQSTNQPPARWKYFLLLPALALAFYACEAVEEAPAPEGGDPTIAVATETGLATQDGEKVYRVVAQMPVFGNREGFSGEERMRCSNTSLMTYLFDQLVLPVVFTLK